MKISIIIPIYKVEAYLHQCVDSVLEQSYRDIEVILVDDGSPDECPGICDEYAKSDARVKVIHKINGGLSDARNYGIEAASGDYLMFLDSDDWWNQSFALNQVVDAIDKTGCDVLVYRLCKYYQNIDKYANVRPTGVGLDTSMEVMMRKNLFVASACDKVVRRSFLNRFDLRFVKGQLSEDIQWCLSLLQFSSKIAFIDLPFYIYRQQNTLSISNNVSRKHLIDMKNVIEKYARMKASPLPNNIYLNHFLANQYVLWLTNTSRSKERDIDDLIKDMKQFWSLIQYSWYPYVHIVNKCSILGYTAVRKLLGFYVKYRHK
ncbi:glycosyltransferase [Bacteroides sp. f07]|uniref:glycosyltransferase family 2 protein n=1 Tax=Bacteroides sp. f07 TaxID=3132704 RepID=UPI0034C0E911